MTSVRIAFDVAAVVWWLRMAFTVSERPASRWRTRWVGKAACLAFLLLFVSVWFGFFVPWGAAVERVARAVARSLISGGNAQRGEWAVAKGLLAVPGSVGLWEDRLDAAAAGSGYGLDRAWSDARSCLGADAALLSVRYQYLRRQVAAGPDT